MPHSICVVLIGTCDTKLDELLYLHNEIAHNSVDVLFIDVGRKPVQHDSIDIRQDQLIRDHGNGQEVNDLPRGEVIKTMAAYATKAVKKLYEERKIHAIVSAGGSGGTSLAAEVMRNAVPIGFPKLIVSTVASGDTGPIVEETDITLMNSVVDVAGLNQILRRVLSNAGYAIASMAHRRVRRNVWALPCSASQRQLSIPFASTSNRTMTSKLTSSTRRVMVAKLWNDWFVKVASTRSLILPRLKYATSIRAAS
jgi:uncharacterized protein (UPF0261 family)